VLVFVIIIIFCLFVCFFFCNWLFCFLFFVFCFLFNAVVEHVGLTAGRSLTTPTVEGQVLAIEGAFSRACIDVDDVSCILF
jgi:hypothetical protein